MSPVESQALTPYVSGTIQMVPGRSGYEPTNDWNGSDGLDYKQTSLEAQRYRTRMLNEKHETTYTENRRLAHSGTSNVGFFVDIYA